MIKLNFNPNKNHITEIQNWLLEEGNETDSGFYCNWEIISDAFEENNAIVITENDFAIGFVIYQIQKLQIDIIIVEIKPSERRKGIAKKLIDGTLDHFKRTGVLVAKLHCSPLDSEAFWKRIGFENFPEIPHNTRLYMFKPLVEILKSTQNAKTNTTISLWNCEPYQVKNSNPKWIWDLNFMADNETLDKPIIFPAPKDWQVELIKNGEKITSNKVKSLPFDIIINGVFMIIRQINLKKQSVL